MKREETSWGGVSDWYDELLKTDGDSYQAQVILPNLLRLLDLKAGIRVLDLACGQGFFSKAFAEAGARVIGADISPELIEKAKKNAPKAEFAVSSADSLDFPDKSFDIITINLAIQNIENVKGVFSESFRLLRPTGRLFIVMNHPAFRIPKKSSWNFDENAKKQYRRIDSYLSESKEKIDMNPGGADNIDGGGTNTKKFTVSFHRPLQFYFKLLNNAGFSITRLEEWISDKKSQAGPRQKEEDRIRKEFPMFLFLEAKKI